MQDLPLGFEFALAQNPEAMKFFANLTATEQNQLMNNPKPCSPARKCEILCSIYHSSKVVFNGS